MSTEQETSLQFFMENSIDIICRAQMDTVLSYVSPSSAQVLGWLPAEMTGKRCEAFFAPEDTSIAAIPAMAAGSPVTVRMRRKNGGLAWVEIRSRVVVDSAKGEPREIILVIRDISDRKSLVERLSVLEGNDPRTGLSTTRVLEECLDREWNRMVRENSQLSLLLLDFDDFRQFHSGSPHFEGDGCLAQIAAVLQPILRVTDAAAHYRAEQIAVLLSATGASGAASVAGKMRIAIHALLVIIAPMTAPMTATPQPCTSASPVHAAAPQPPTACPAFSCSQPRAPCTRPSNAMQPSLRARAEQVIPRRTHHRATCSFSLSPERRPRLVSWRS